MASLQTLWQDRRAWLLDAALPLWSSAGVDPAGGFHNRLDDRAQPLVEPKRLRVQARQVVVYAQAQRLGWNGPWRAMIDEGLRFIRIHAGPDGLLPSLYDGGQAWDLNVYDQAFVLLALAHARSVLGDPALERDAEKLFGTLVTRFGRADGGFNENAGQTPLRANPNMHLFEAMLAWQWRDAADALRRLALGTFIDPATGFLREYFTDGGKAVTGQKTDVEPGHMFEWGSLLLMSGASEAEAERLIRKATLTGVDRTREAAVNSLYIDGTVADGEARLWVQTERLRATLLMAERGQDRAYWLSEAFAGEAALRRYLDVPHPGSWRDTMRADGTIPPDPAMASSLYHIMGAYLALKHAAETL
ncbi:MAG TPA: AGE family epimerase/isomerase [Rhizomicrobium sp.]|jgi:mannose-6-phosphate isomerase